jgi:hypothetical protein
LTIIAFGRARWKLDFFVQNSKYPEEPDGFCAEARKSVPIEQEQTEDTKSTSQLESWAQRDRSCRAEGRRLMAENF